MLRFCRAAAAARRLPRAVWMSCASSSRPPRPRRARPGTGVARLPSPSPDRPAPTPPGHLPPSGGSKARCAAASRPVQGPPPPCRGRPPGVPDRAPPPPPPCPPRVCTRRLHPSPDRVGNPVVRVLHRPPAEDRRGVDRHRKPGGPRATRHAAPLRSQTWPETSCSTRWACVERLAVLLAHSFASHSSPHATVHRRPYAVRAMASASETPSGAGSSHAPHHRDGGTPGRPKSCRYPPDTIRGAKPRRTGGGRARRNRSPPPRDRGTHGPDDTRSPGGERWPSMGASSCFLLPKLPPTSTGKPPPSRPGFSPAFLTRGRHKN